MRLVPDKRLRGNSGDVMLPGEQIYGANVVPRGSREQAQVLAGCGKRFLEAPSDIAIARCDASTHAIITE